MMLSLIPVVGPMLAIIVTSFGPQLVGFVVAHLVPVPVSIAAIYAEMALVFAIAF